MKEKKKKNQIQVLIVKFFFPGGTQTEKANQQPTQPYKTMAS